MQRSFEARDLVRLPRLDYAGTLALVNSMIAASREFRALPPPIATARNRLEQRYAALREAAASQRTPLVVDTARARQADIALDATWSALFDWATGWSKLPVPQAARAELLLTSLFTDKLRFTQLPYKLEWAESDTRLLQIERDGLDAVFRELGGEVILQTLRAAHREYGDALGITRVPTPAQLPPSLREPLDATFEAMRAYVVRIAAHVDEDEEGSDALAKALLTPVTEWQVRERSLAAAAAATAAPAPASDTAPKS
jgi:hypothetical protein